jgi:hypothetical protein
VGRDTLRTISVENTDLRTVVAEARALGSLRLKLGNDYFVLTHEDDLLPEAARRFLMTGGRVKSDD